MFIDVFNNDRQRFLRQFPEGFQVVRLCQFHVLIYRRLIDGLDLLDNRLHQRAEQSFLIVKVVIKSSVSHMGVLANLPDAGPLKAIFQKVLLGTEQKIFVGLLKVS